MGNIYEMRIYTYANGSMPELLRRWADSLPYREEFSPLAAGMYTEFGNLNRWMHVWPYQDLNHRAEVRAEASKIPQWPSGAPGPRQPGKQNYDTGQLLADALSAPGCHCERSVAISSL